MIPTNLIKIESKTSTQQVFLSNLSFSSVLFPQLFWRTFTKGRSVLQGTIQCIQFTFSRSCLKTFSKGYASAHTGPRCVLACFIGEPSHPLRATVEEISAQPPSGAKARRTLGVGSPSPWPGSHLRECWVSGVISWGHRLEGKRYNPEGLQSPPPEDEEVDCTMGWAPSPRSSHNPHYPTSETLGVPGFWVFSPWILT